jgi:hypothetical protein
MLPSIAPQQLEFESVWRNYMLLETLDYLSLLTCFGFESSACGPVPTIAGRWEQLSVRRLGPSEVELMPFPFSRDRLEVDVECVHLECPRFGSDDELRSQLRSTRPEVRRTIYQIGRN